MPKFELDTGGHDGTLIYSRLDPFTQGYVEAMFFTNASNADDGDLADVTVADLAPDTVEQIKTDCADFQRINKRSLDLAYDYAPNPKGYDERQAGCDFWFTRNGHGVGFWDRGLGEVGKVLSEACGWHNRASPPPTFPERDLYRGDDGKVYLS